MTFRRLLPFIAALLLLGCPEGTGPGAPHSLDSSGVGPATVGLEYSGALAVTDYEGPAAFYLNAGTLPDGLELDAAGRITGVPVWLETQTMEVLVSGLDGIDDLIGDVTVSVDAEGLDAQLGYEHDQLNNMLDVGGKMTNIWLRVEGSGEEGQGEWTMNPGVYLPGGDGIHEAGMGDDVRIGDLDFRALEWTFTHWRATRDPTTSNGYPSVHLPDGEPPSFTGRGVFSSHADTGQADLTLTHPAYPNTVEKKVQVVPPDWCPNGESDGPNLGVCE